MTATRGSERTAVVWDALSAHLSGERLDVLDIGGGTGGFAVRVAQMGHRVTVVDPSPDALASLGRRARELGIEVAARQGDITEVGQPDDSVDLVMCHGVLEMVEDPVVALGGLAQVMRPHGTLSLLVAQRHSSVVAKAMAGHFVEARTLLDATGSVGRIGRRFTAAEITDVLSQAGFALDRIRGVRTFADLVPGALIDAEAGASEALAQLELAVSDRPEFWPLAAQLHVLATA